MPWQPLDVAGQTANVFAHDFNNLLVVIQGYCDLLLMKATDDTLTERLGRIRAAAEAAAALSKQLLALGRRNTGIVSAVDLNLQLRTLRPSIERSLPPNVKKAFLFADDAPLALVDAGLVDQIVMHLVINALDAMPTGGTLTIVTDAAAAAPAGVPAGATVCLRVRDTGLGMDDAVRARLFEPGFTTKASDGHAGLGLAAVRAAARQLGGDVTVESAPGTGTTVAVWLPAAAEVLTPAVGITPAAGRGARVLLVDAHDAVRDALVAGLGAAGFAVTAVPSAAAARAAISGEFAALVVADILADGGGAAVAAELQRDRPALRVLVLTGGTVRTSASAGGGAFGFRSLAKPFTLHTLIVELRAVLSFPTADTSL